MKESTTHKVVFIVHYFPPVNSSGAKRVEAMSKYMAARGHDVTVITTRKTSADGAFTERYPLGVKVVELNWAGRRRRSCESNDRFEPMYIGKPSAKRLVKDFVMTVLGQLPDPRLPFALSLMSPWLAVDARHALAAADVVIGSCPPWPNLLAAVIAKRRFRVPCILDYRDHFSECHEMPGSRFAKWLERKIDRWLVDTAGHVVTVSEPMAQYYRTMSPNVSTILNGYDSEVLDIARAQAARPMSDEVVIRYMGIVSPGRVPHRFLQALVRFRESNRARFDRLRVEFYGNANLVDVAVNSQYPTIRSAIVFREFVPYVQSLQLMVEADYLLFAETSSVASVSAQGILTTKLFEYIGSGRPILADISLNTVAGALIMKTGNYHVVGDTVDMFFDELQHERFFRRREDSFSDAVKSLSRESQALEYTALVRRVAAKGQVRAREDT